MSVVCPELSRVVYHWSRPVYNGYCLSSYGDNCKSVVCPCNERLSAFIVILLPVQVCILSVFIFYECNGPNKVFIIHLHHFVVCDDVTSGCMSSCYVTLFPCLRYVFCYSFLVFIMCIFINLNTFVCHL